MIEESRRKEILLYFKSAVESYGEGGQTPSSKLLPISYIKKPLRQLQLRSLGAEDVKRYFEDDDIQAVDADMFLTFAASKSIQLDKSNKAFELIDEAQKGVVVIEDLQRVCLELEEPITEEELIEMMEYADPTGEGLLKPKHFFRLAQKMNL